MDKQKNISVSVIIPMYNAEKYIAECLDSLYKQTLKNFEIILVNDCSTDNSVAIVEKYMKRGGPEQFSLMQTSRQSGCPGIPRNIALEHAKGEYIYFMDSDDFLDKDVLETFYKVAKKFNADIVYAQKTFHYKKIDNKFTNVIYHMPRIEFVENATLEIDDISERFKNYASWKYSGWVWDKFFKRKFLINNNIKFPTMTILEDYIFLVMCWVMAKNYVVIPSIGYHYRVNSESVTHTQKVLDKYLLSLLEGVYSLDNFMQNQNFFIENPNARYLGIETFYQLYQDRVGKILFFDLNLSPGETYVKNLEHVFSHNPEKTVPFATYLFVSTSIYKLLFLDQSKELKRLKDLLTEHKINF